MSKATEAFEALVKGMDELRPACRGSDLFTIDQEDVTADDLIVMDELCRVCPLQELCRTYATAARPTGGRWAGKYYTRHQGAVAA